MTVFKNKTDGHEQGLDEKGGYCLFLIIKTTMLHYVKQSISSSDIGSTWKANGITIFLGEIHAPIYRRYFVII